MKIIYNINKVAFIITLALYVTVIYGMFSQMILGGIQVISATILFLFWKNFSKKTKEHLSIYWAISSIYGICWLFKWNSFNETFILVFGIMILPMAIAGYFLYILNSIKHIKK
ncbi:MAG: hypothetical protein V7719_08505 [Psychroserpens sp.]|uniref:hypothetical protein n=1 Tax=Psychroserpens sp. TaxID=2020870 RepID=UPI0030014122